MMVQTGGDNREESGRNYVGQKVDEIAKWKVSEACVVPACVHGLGTLSLIGRQDEKVHVAENNWARRKGSCAGKTVIERCIAAGLASW